MTRSTVIPHLLRGEFYRDMRRIRRDWGRLDLLDEFDNSPVIPETWRLLKEFAADLSNFVLEEK